MPLILCITTRASWCSHGFDECVHAFESCGQHAGYLSLVCSTTLGWSQMLSLECQNTFFEMSYARMLRFLCASDRFVQLSVGVKRLESAHDDSISPVDTTAQCVKSATRFERRVETSYAGSPTTNHGSTSLLLILSALSNDKQLVQVHYSLFYVAAKLSNTRSVTSKVSRSLNPQLSGKRLIPK